MRKWLITTIYIGLNIVLIAFIFVFFFVFANRFEQDFRDQYVQNFQTLIETKLDEKISNDYETFENLTTNKSLVELNNDITLGNISTQTPYVQFVKVNNGSFVFKSETYYLVQNHLLSYKLGFIGEYFYFIKDDIVGIFLSSNYFESVFTLTDALNSFIIDNEGEIFFHSSEDISFSVLHEYLTLELSSDVIGKTAANTKEITIHTTHNNKKSLFKFTSLPSYPNLYVSQHFLEDKIASQATHYTTFLLILLVLFTALSLFILLFIFYYLSNKYNDIEAKRLMYYYNKPYIIFVDKKGKIKKANKTLVEALGKKPLHLKQLMYDFNSEVVISQIDRGSQLSLQIGEDVRTFIPVKARGGYYLLARTDFENMVDPKLERLAYVSRATNLANYYKLLTDLEKYHNEILTNLIQRVTLISFDIKGFSRIRRNLKQEVADSVLKAVADIISNFIVDDENIYLYNQDDVFTLLLVSKDKKMAESLSKKILNTFEKPLEVGRNKMSLSFVAAILELNNELDKILDPKETLLHLDETLKRAKALTTSNYLIYDETISHYVNFKTKMEEDLIVGLEKDEFTVYLQPKYNYATDRIVGFEALVRWNHPSYLNVSPLEYVTLAEENGRIVELGNIVKRKSFEAAKALEKYNVRVSLNLSPVEIMQQGFIDDFLNEYKKYNFRDNTIIAEITETAIIESITVINEKLNILQKNGILIHLDDFGTGYSTLPYIKDLRFNAIKIDKMYVDYVDTDNYSKAVVSMIIDLAKALDLAIIAEGVENERQMKQLSKLGCNVIQGYLISPAVPLAEAIELVEDYNINKTKGFKGGKK